MTVKPLVQLHLLVGLYATTAILGELLSVSAPVLVCWRTALAAVGGFLWVRAIGLKAIWPGTRDAAKLIGIGALVGGHWLGFFGAIKLANVSICLAGMATISFFTAFTEPLITRRRVRPFEALLGLLVVGGFLLIAGVERAHWLGLGVALVGAVLAAAFPVFNQLVVRRGIDARVMVGWEMLGACGLTLLLLPLFDPAGYAALAAPTALDWVLLLILAWVCTVFAYALHIHLLRRLSAYVTNLAMNFEPVYGILAATILFGEWRQLHPAFYLGVLAILAANLIHPWLDRKFRTLPPAL
jgi:drug/metabolite transporter (DMT)-like permease